MRRWIFFVFLFLLFPSFSVCQCWYHDPHVNLYQCGSAQPVLWGPRRGCLSTSSSATYCGEDNCCLFDDSGEKSVCTGDSEGDRRTIFIDWWDGSCHCKSKEVRWDPDDGYWITCSDDHKEAERCAKGGAICKDGYSGCVFGDLANGEISSTACISGDEQCEEACGADSECDEGSPWQDVPGDSDEGKYTCSNGKVTGLCSPYCDYSTDSAVYADIGTCEQGCGADPQCDEKTPGEDGCNENCQYVGCTPAEGSNFCKYSDLNPSTPYCFCIGEYPETECSWESSNLKDYNGDGLYEYICTAENELKECKYGTACTQADSRYCTYTTSWEWSTAQPTVIYSNEILCRGTAAYYCNSTHHTLCQKKTANDEDDYWCTGSGESGTWEWSSSRGPFYYADYGGEVICGDNGEVYVCNSTTLEKAARGEASAKVIISSKTYYCINEAGKYRWVEGGDAYDYGPFDSIYLWDEGKFVVCNSTNLCGVYDVSGTNYQCLVSSSDGITMGFEQVSSPVLGPINATVLCYQQDTNYRVAWCGSGVSGGVSTQGRTDYLGKIEISVKMSEDRDSSQVFLTVFDSSDKQVFSTTCTCTGNDFTCPLELWRIELTATNERRKVFRLSIEDFPLLALRLRQDCSEPQPTILLLDSTVRYSLQRESDFLWHVYERVSLADTWECLTDSEGNRGWVPTNFTLIPKENGNTGFALSLSAPTGSDGRIKYSVLGSIYTNWADYEKSVSRVKMSITGLKCFLYAESGGEENSLVENTLIEGEGLEINDDVRVAEISGLSGNAEQIVSACGNSKFDCRVRLSCSYTLKVTHADGTAVKYSKDVDMGRILYNDEGFSCLYSSDCLGWCRNVNVSLEGGGMKIKLGKCSGMSPSGCAAGDMIETRVVIQDGNIMIQGNPFDLMCSNETLSAGCCSSDCTWTCANYFFPNSLSISLSDGEKTATISGEYVDYLFADHFSCEPDEDPQHCKDCCVVPGIGLNTEFPDRYGPEYGDCKSYYFSTLDSQNYKELRCGTAAETDICMSNCGASGCDGKPAGGRDCTEWCAPRDSYPVLIRLYKNGQEASSVDSCTFYDLCILFPYNPFPDGRKVDVEVVGHSVIVGNNVKESEETFVITPEDVPELISDGGFKYWKICTSQGKPLKFVLSKREYDTGKTEIRLRLTIHAADGDYTTDSSLDLTSLVGTKEECDFGSTCIHDEDCKNYNTNGEIETDWSAAQTPVCTNFICIDPDLEGVMFQLTFSPTFFNTEEGWDFSTCKPGSCTFTLTKCCGYYIGINTTYSQFISQVDRAEIILSGVEAKVLCNFSTSKSGIFGLKCLKEGEEQKYVFVPALREGNVTVILHDDTNSKDAFTFARVAIEGEAACKDAYVSDSTVSGTDIFCLSDRDCQHYLAPSDDSVSRCEKMNAKSWSLGGITGFFEPAGFCYDICGNGVCDEGYETPFICTDCCSQFGTGRPGADWNPTDGDWSKTCYTYCGASPECENRSVGEVVDNYVCNVECKAESGETVVKEVEIGPQSYILGSECSDTDNDGSVDECTAHFLFEKAGQRLSLSLFIPRGQLDFVTDYGHLRFMRNVTVNVKLNGRNVGFYDREPVYSQSYNAYRFDISLVPDPALVENTFEIEVRQMNFLPHRLTLTLIPTFTTLTGMITTYAEENELERWMREDPSDFTLEFWSEGIDFRLENVYVNCTLDGRGVVKNRIIPPVDGCQQSASCGAKGSISLDFPSILPGKHTLACEAVTPYFLPISLNKTFEVYGRIKSAEAEIPSEIVPGKAYSLPVLSVKDEFGRSISSYHYSWGLKIGNVIYPLSYDSPEVYIPFVSATAENVSLVLDVSAPYYLPLTIEYPTTFTKRVFLSVAVVPAVSYVGLEGGNVTLRVTVENRGPAATFSIRCGGIDGGIAIPGEKFEVWGWDVKEVPVFIFIPPSLDEEEYQITCEVLSEGERVGVQTVKIIQTDKAIYQFGVYPAHQEVDIIAGSGRGNITIHNTGNRMDTYIITSTVELDRREITLGPGKYEVVGFTLTEPGQFEVCVKSVTLLSQTPECVAVNGIRRIVKPKLMLEDQNITLRKGIIPALMIKLATAEYSGRYVIEVGGDIGSITDYCDARSNSTTTCPVPVNVSPGVYSLSVKVYPMLYPSEFDEGQMVLKVKAEVGYEIELLLRNVENNLESLGPEKEKFVEEYEYAKGLIREGKFEEAKAILQKINEEIAKSLEVKAARERAAYVKPYRPTFPIIAGILFIALGLIFYLK